MLDVAQNSVSAGASLIEIDVTEDRPADRLTVTIRANSPFKKYGTWSQRTINGNYSGNSFSRFYNRDYGINISYRFGSLKAQVKKTNTTIQNTDMVGGSSKSPTK